MSETLDEIRTKFMMMELSGEGSRMTLDQFQLTASNTMDPSLSFHERLMHALCGLSSETGEVMGLFQKRLQGHLLEPEELQKELGDVLWFLSAICTAFGWRLSEIAELNRKKLRARYPDGKFDPERSVNREV